MEAMLLGGYTFWRNPVLFDDPKEYRSTSSVSTYSSYAFFSYGTFLGGQEVVLEWDWMTESMFDTLQTLLEQDTAHEWNPQTGTLYIVEILKLEGKYVESALEDAPWRRSVKLTLLVKSIST